MRIRSFALACVLITALAVPVGSASAVAPAPPVRVGRTPRLPPGAQRTGTLSPTTVIDAVVTLEPRDPAALGDYAQQVSDPGSDVYRAFLSVPQFARRFGPTPTQIAAVRSALRTQGLEPGPVSANGLAIPVVARAAAIGHAFSTSFERYRLRNGQTAFANSQAPSLSRSAARFVQGVVGLDTLATPQPVGLRRAAARASATPSPQVATGGPQPCAAASSAANTADQIASAYRFSHLYGAGDLGSGQTVALYELEAYGPSDIAAYQSCYGTDASVSTVSVDGGDGHSDGSGESALDIEDVIGLVPDAKILVYEGPNGATDNAGSGPYDTFSAIISQDKAKVISTSWGLCESQEGTADASGESSLFEEAATQGQSIFASSGDDGAEDCTDDDGPVDQLAVDDPAAQPYVTGVGGTTLSALGPPPSEPAWNSTWEGGGSGAGGGGISMLWSMPSYQSGAPASLDVVNPGSSGSPCASTAGPCREVPDVSADADPNTGYAIYYDGSWDAFGGTSAAAPTWAALMALTNASSVCHGNPIGFANPALYGAAADDYAAVFNDVVTGNNDFTGTGGFAASGGYDMASGLGTPDGAPLATALCDPVKLSNPGNQSSAVDASTSLQLSATSSAGAAISFSASGLPAGLSITAATGVISGTPTSAGTHTVTAIATDANGSAGNTTFTWSVTGAPGSQASTTPASPARTPTTTSTAPSETPPAVSAARVSVSTPRGQSGRVGKPQRLQIEATDSSGREPSYSAAHLPAGLSITPGTGLIAGTPRTPGRSRVTVLVTDPSGVSASTSFVWTVAGKPYVGRSGVRSLNTKTPAIVVRLAAGFAAPAIRSIIVRLPAGLRSASRARELERGIRATGPHGARITLTARAVGAGIEIKLHEPTSSLRLALASPAIGSSTRPAATALRDRTSIVLSLVVADASGAVTPITARVPAQVPPKST